MLNKNKANKAFLISFMATYVRACLPFMHGSVIDNGRGALAENPEVALVRGNGRGESGRTVCRQYFLGTSFEFADLASHWAAQ